MDAQRAATETTTTTAEGGGGDAMLLFRGLLDEKQISQHFPTLNFTYICFLQHSYPAALFDIKLLFRLLVLSDKYLFAFSSPSSSCRRRRFLTQFCEGEEESGEGK